MLVGLEDVTEDVLRADVQEDVQEDIKQDVQQGGYVVVQILLVVVAD